jgi:hypothetical protein
MHFGIIHHEELGKQLAMKQIQIAVNGRSFSKYEFYVEEALPNFLIMWMTDC